MTTRAEIMRRARTGWTPGTVPYAQWGTASPTGHRPDCSGYVSMCLGLPAPGLTTVTLATTGTLVEIPSDLQPGDVVGSCGPGTAGDAGHVIVFEDWVTHDDADNRYWGWEQAGGRNGPVRRIINYPDDGYPGRWKSWRLSSLSEDASTTSASEGDIDMVSIAGEPIEQYLPRIERALWWPIPGLVTKIDKIAADLAAERTAVAALQAAVTALGAAINSTATGTPLDPLDTAAILARVDQRAAEVLALVEHQHAQEVAALRAELAALTTA